jgi:CrcB protein
MRQFLLVALGGFVGTALRYGLTGAIARTKAGSVFPFGTFTVNLLGCLVIGALAALVDTRGILTGTSRAVIFIGVLGGFTTFSSFGYETLQMVKGGQILAAGTFIVMQIVLCLPAVWLGDVAVRTLWGR